MISAEARDNYLSEMQRDHEQRSQVEERKIRKEVAAEEARRKEIALRETQERELKARLEVEAKMKADLLLQTEKRKAAAEAARKQQAETAAAAALRRTEEERKSKQEEGQKMKESTLNLADIVLKEEGSVDISFTGPKPRAAEKAAKLETERFQKLRLLQESTKLLQSNPALTKELKSLERLIIKILQQIAATQEQVRNKSIELTALLSDGSKPQQFLILTLASKLLSQCESQVLKLPSFAFPLAQVVVNVAAQIPFVMDVVLAKLNAACIFTVPKYFIFSKNQYENDIAYYKMLGYQEVDNKLESTDEFLARMMAYMTFYAAITQTETSVGSNPHGLKEAWAWCAHLLNKIPANRYSASALEAFLKIAGFRLYQVYPKPFVKVMQSIMNEFVVNLKKHNDPDTKAVINRLETYLLTQQFMVEPEGHQMPRTDLSSSMRA
ncbi:hypothetical protein O6H91_18G085000 [Diphasiastrum complanatum]|uniref:Uncharacterized protein n=1 Tax=Diphasiastrum complanatum TaxID=34168 RepID=A0ACC2B3H5_DIPCM|nr:hypothetical protein O6H91_18G085000 [Diphasiastrum complanatum]